MSEIINIKLRVDSNLAKTLRIICDKFDIDNDVVDLTPENINVILSVDEALKLGDLIGDLLLEFSNIKEKSQILKN